MTGNKKLFMELKDFDGGHVSFGKKEKGKIVGIDKIGNHLNQVSNVAYVKGLKFDLLSVSQLCDKGCMLFLVEIK